MAMALLVRASNGFCATSKAVGKSKNNFLRSKFQKLSKIFSSKADFLGSFSDN
jgi:hypothetical protein